MHGKVENIESGGNIVFCGVKVVVTYCQKIVPTTECSFIWRERKEDKLGASAFPYTVLVCRPLQPCCLPSLPPFPPPSPHQSFSPKKACVCVCVRSKSTGNEQVLLQEVLYPNYLSCRFISRPLASGIYLASDQKSWEGKRALTRKRNYFGKMQRFR